MSARRPRSYDVRTCSKSLASGRKLGVVRQSPARRSRLHHMREHAVALVLAMLALIALAPALVTPSDDFELIATGALTLIACVLVAVIYGSLSR
jgi:hypothetical protein